MVHLCLLLVLVAVALQSSTTTNAEHHPLCEYAMNGSFSGHLISITWQGMNSLYFALSSSLIKVKSGAIEANGISLDGAHSLWQEETFRSLISEKQAPKLWKLLGDGRNLKSFFILYHNDNGRQHHQVFMVLDGRFYAYDSNSFVSSELASQSGGPLYSVIFEQWMEKVGDLKLKGYVIMNDVFDRTDHLIIYDLEMAYGKEGYMVPLTNAVDHFYYLSTEHPGTLNLMHRMNRPHTVPSSIKAPFKQRPSGFLKDNQLHLFDDQVGCVRIVDIGPISLHHEYMKASKINLHRNVTNVPYERYFKCPEQYKPPAGLNASRCGSANAPTLYPIASTRKPIWDVPFSSKDIQFVVVMLLGLGLLLLFCGCMCFMLVKRKKKTSTGKKKAARSSRSKSLAGRVPRKASSSNSAALKNSEGKLRSTSLRSTSATSAKGGTTSRGKSVLVARYYSSRTASNDFSGNVLQAKTKAKSGSSPGMSGASSAPMKSASRSIFSQVSSK